MQDYKIIDAHCDTLMKLNDSNADLSPDDNRHVSMQGLQDGNVALQCFAVFTGPRFQNGPCLQRGLKSIDNYYRMIDTYRDRLHPVTSSGDFLSAMKTGCIGSLLTVEGGDILEGELSNLRIIYMLGVRLVTLTWMYRNELADGIMEKHAMGGLSDFGLAVVKEMDRLGMIIDVSHLSVKGFWDVVENSGKPVVASHSNAKRLCPHERNLDDDQIRALAQKDGFIGINFFPGFLAGENASLNDIIRHIEYIASLVGTDCVGFGSDFDGVGILPCGIKGPQAFPQIVESLLKLNYSGEDVIKICSGNFLRVLKTVVG